MFCIIETSRHTLRSKHQKVVGVYYTEANALDAKRALEEETQVVLDKQRLLDRRKLPMSYRFLISREYAVCHVPMGDVVTDVMGAFDALDKKFEAEVDALKAERVRH